MNEENCNLCGECNSDSNEYRATLNESHSPRYMLFLVRSKRLSARLYDLSDSKTLYRNCPASVCLDMQKIRGELVKRGIETTANKRMRTNIIRYGNPFGDVKPGDKIDDFYT